MIDSIYLYHYQDFVDVNEHERMHVGNVENANVELVLQLLVHVRDNYV